MLSTGQAERVIASYAAIARAPDDYSALFYHRLFERHPFVRSLFPDDLAPQVAIFRKTLDALVAALHDPSALRPILAETARRHVTYGVRTAHYAFVGEVLIDTFAELSGSTFTYGTRRAWEALYTEVAGIMIAAADRGG